jgi:hypothetical protein
MDNEYNRTPSPPNGKHEPTGRTPPASSALPSPLTASGSGDTRTGVEGHAAVPTLKTTAGLIAARRRPRQIRASHPKKSYIFKYMTSYKTQLSTKTLFYKQLIK